MKKDFVATGAVLNHDRTKALLIYHNKLEKWCFPGGHLEDNELPHEGALREVFEETGIIADVFDHTHGYSYSDSNEWSIPSPYCMMEEIIPAYKSEPEHIHVDFIYLMEAESDQEALHIQLHEVKDAKWFNKHDVLLCNTFDSIKEVCRQVMYDSD